MKRTVGCESDFQTRVLCNRECLKYGTLVLLSACSEGITKYLEVGIYRLCVASCLAVWQYLSVSGHSASFVIDNVCLSEPYTLLSSPLCIHPLTSFPVPAHSSTFGDISPCWDFILTTTVFMSFFSIALLHCESRGVFYISGLLCKLDNLSQKEELFKKSLRLHHNFVVGQVRII